nr:hypothetical protein CFP56_72784 [Quercus suber]
MASVRLALRLGPRAQSMRPAPVSRTLPIAQRSYASASTVMPRPASGEKPASEAEQANEDLEDVNMNGNYPDPSLTSALPIKRQHRDPYGDWWDKQERRNYGEPLHEDNDILGIFSPEDYTHFTPGKGLLLWAGFLGAVGFLSAAVYQYLPDRPSAPRTYPGGLEKELGGPRAPRARKTEDDDAALVEQGSRSTVTLRG